MVDYFLLLGQPRRPWLDEEVLKAEFLKQSGELHPDRTHNASPRDKQASNERYVELNAAYQCLRVPKERVRHLLELETGRKPSDLTDVPEDLMTDFFEVGKLLREVDAFIWEKAKATSPMLQVQLFERAQEWTDRLAEMRKALAVKRDLLLDELKGMNANEPLPVIRLLVAWRLLSFYERWLSQLSERSTRLLI